MHGSVSPQTSRPLDGLAVVSDIVASNDPLSAAKKLGTIIKAFKNAQSVQAHVFSQSLNGPTKYTSDEVKRAVGKALADIREFGPLVHQVCTIKVFMCFGGVIHGSLFVFPIHDRYV